MVAWSIGQLQTSGAKAGGRLPALLGAVCLEAAPRAAGLEAQHVSVMLHACGKIGLRNRCAFGPRLIKGCSKPYPVCFSRARMHRPFAEAAVRQLVSRLHQFRPQELFNAVYGLSLLQMPVASPEELADVEAEVAARIHEFKSQELVLTMWSLQRLGFAPRELLLRAEVQLQHQRIGELMPQHLAILLWVFGEAGQHPSAATAAELLRELRAKLPLLNPRQLTMVLSSLVRLRLLPDPSLLEDLEASLVRRLPNVSAAEAAQCLWAFAAMDHRPGTLLLAMMGEPEVGYPLVMHDRLGLELMHQTGRPDPCSSCRISSPGQWTRPE